MLSAMIPDGLIRKLVLFALPLGVMTGVLVGLTGLTPGLDQSLGTLGKTAAQARAAPRLARASTTRMFWEIARRARTRKS